MKTINNFKKKTEGNLHERLYGCYGGEKADSNVKKIINEDFAKIFLTESKFLRPFKGRKLTKDQIAQDLVANMVTKDLDDALKLVPEVVSTSYHIKDAYIFYDFEEEPMPAGEIQYQIMRRSTYY